MDWNFFMAMVRAGVGEDAVICGYVSKKVDLES